MATASTSVALVASATKGEERLFRCVVMPLLASLALYSRADDFRRELLPILGAREIARAIEGADASVASASTDSILCLRVSFGLYEEYSVLELDCRLLRNSGARYICMDDAVGRELDLQSPVQRIGRFVCGWVELD
ncbi:MAG: hypothetical protein HY791_21330 [Deltaproteobacteria bacterium]|nr:hypothetical protein [Deltaproteobacteria bacterium]